MTGGALKKSAMTGSPLGRTSSPVTGSLVVSAADGVEVSTKDVTTGVGGACVTPLGLAVGAKIAVNVKLGVGKAKGVGEAAPGMVQADRATARAMQVRVRLEQAIGASHAVVKILDVCILAPIAPEPKSHCGDRLNPWAAGRRHSGRSKGERQVR
jgi:hypothetical protein